MMLRMEDKSVYVVCVFGELSLFSANSRPRPVQSSVTRDRDHMLRDHLREPRALISYRGETGRITESKM